MKKDDVRIEISVIDEIYGYELNGDVSDILTAMLFVVAEIIEKNKKYDATDIEVENVLLRNYREVVSTIRKRGK